ncbi:MAG: TetR/AcrR family transcriptional regulator [Solirubrobacterales bacterium]
MATEAAKPAVETVDSDVPRRADAVRNRERVIEAAAEVFAEQGIDAGVPEVAERAGVGKGTVYRNFETKDDLVAAVLAMRQADFTAAVQRALEQEDAWQAFRELLLDTVRGKMRTSKLVLGLRAFDQHEPLKAERAKSLGYLDQLMQKAIKQGTMREDAKPEDVSVLFGGVCRLLNERGEQDPKVWRRHTDQVVDAFRVQPS